MINLVQYNSNK